MRYRNVPGLPDPGINIYRHLQAQPYAILSLRKSRISNLSVRLTASVCIALGPCQETLKFVLNHIHLNKIMFVKSFVRRY